MELAAGGSTGAHPLAPANTSAIPEDHINTCASVGANVEVASVDGRESNLNSAPNLYGEGSQGPFLVFIQYKPIQSAESDLSSLNIFPLSVGKLIEKNRVADVLLLKKTGRNRIEVSLKSGKSANKLATADFLKQKNYYAFIPSFSTVRLGLVKGLDNDLSDEEIIEAINNRNPIKAKSIRRLNFRSSDPHGNIVWKPSRTVVITFEGQKLPERIIIFYNSLPVETYALPVTQCRTCLRFGHLNKTCRAKSPRCFRCGEAHLGDSCSNTETLVCVNCHGNHRANDLSCPEYMRQKAIKQVMAKDGISFNEAASRFPKINRNSYASVTAPIPPQPSIFKSTPTPLRPRIITIDPSRSGKTKGKGKKRKISTPPTPNPRLQADPTSDLRWDYFPERAENGSCLNRQPKSTSLDEIASLMRLLLSKINRNSAGSDTSCSDTSFRTVTDLPSLKSLAGGRSTAS